MKNILWLSMCLGFVAPIKAQTNPDNPYRHVASLSLGNALALRTLTVADTGELASRTSSGVIGLLYDYKVGDRFSIGGNVSYQSFVVTLRDSFSSTLLEQGGVNRLYLGIRGIFTWTNKERFDLYSGFKLGYIMFRTGNISGPNASRSNIEQGLNNSRPSIGFIPLGMRYFVTDELGIMLESSLGVPTFMSVGLSYRFR